MVELVIAIVVVAALAVMSIRASRRLKPADRLPMQWSFSGEVTGTARRRLALSFTPAVAALSLCLIVTLTIVASEPRSGHADLATAVVLLVGTFFIGFHAIHLRLMARKLE